VVDILFKIKYKLIYILLCVYCSCSTYKNSLASGNGTKKQVIDNVIADYYHTNGKEIKKYNVFSLSDKTEDQKLVYHITVIPQENVYSVTKNDSLGAFSKGFPTNYEYYKGKLFVWNDTERHITSEILNVLKNHNMLDSTQLKYELGIYDEWNPEKESPELPLFKINDFLEGVNYVVCKNNISIYKKLKTSEYIPSRSNKLPEVDCN